MTTSRREVLLGGLAGVGVLAAGSQSLAGCAAGGEGDGEGGAEQSETLTKVTIIGAIHGRHLGSERYSLGVLEQAVRAAKPDIVLTEIPPDRLAEAQSSFAATGEVTESRTRAFPELTDVVFPLAAEMGFEIAACSGWTKAIADNRREALRAIEADPSREAQWLAHQTARAIYSRDLAGRGDDPRFIHTPDYDMLVELAQTPYQNFFDGDLGPSGWTQINKAHTDLIEAQLDRISGQGLNALVIFGAWHKYMIDRALNLRSDVTAEQARALFT